MTDSCRWNYNYWYVCFSICLLFSVLLSSSLLWLGAGGAAHVVSSGLHYAGLTAGSLINGWSQRGQTQELKGSCTQQHPAHSTTIQHYMWVALTTSITFFNPVFYACTGTEVKPRALGWIKYYIVLYIIIKCPTAPVHRITVWFPGLQTGGHWERTRGDVWARWCQLTLILTHTQS